MSVLAGQFTGNADNWLIIGDSDGESGGGDFYRFLGVPGVPGCPARTYAYKYNDGVLSTPPALLPMPYFDDKAEYEAFESQWDPCSKTHTPRLWTTDLNQDGLPDILAGQVIWTAGAAGHQKAVIQLLINQGGMVFTDETDALAPEFNKDSWLDFSMRWEDVDGSGIDTMFLSPPNFRAANHGQYILVNDGTGRLFAAMHDEFQAMEPQIADFVRGSRTAAAGVEREFERREDAPLAVGYRPRAEHTPQFIAYRTASGTINFVAVVRTLFVSEPPPLVPPPDLLAFVNVPLSINLTTDFRRDLTVSTRNGSKRIRTFAGDDTIYRALTDPDCSIDGGLGTDTVVYPGKRADWVLTRTDETLTVRPAAGGGIDTLTNIEKAAFDDQTVDLTAL